MARPTTGGGARIGRSRKRRPPTGVFAPPQRADAPITRAQRAAGQRVDRARRRLPKVPIAAPPILRHPTPTQTAAARKLITASVNRAVGGGTGREQLARRQALTREIFTDPRYARERASIQHYARAQANHAALQVAKAYGARGTREQRLQAGHVLLAARTQRDRVRPGVAPFKVDVAGVGITPSNILAAAQGVTSLGGASAENTFVKRTLADVGTLGSAPFVGGLTLANLATDPVAGQNLLGSAAITGAKLVPAVAKQTVHEFTHPAESFSQHPLLTALDFAGAASALGRTAGAAARGLGSTAEAGGLRGALGRTGSTVRPPLALHDDAGAAAGGHGLLERTYSKDSTRKAGQVAADARKQPLRDADGKVVTVEQRGRRVPVLKASEGERARHLKREADFTASRANSVERMVRERAAHEMHVRGIRSRRARDLVSMVVEGTITTSRHFEQDLRAEADRIRGHLERQKAGEPVYRHRGELKAAQARLKLVEEAVRDPRVAKQREKIVAAGEDIGRRLNEHEAEAIGLGFLDPSRAARARLVPAAVAHMGARHFTAEELTAGGEKVQHGSIRHPDGRFMANGDVEGLLRSRGRDPESVAYLPHRLDTRGARAFHTQFRPGSRPTLDKPESRTGRAYARGVTEASTDLILEHGVRQQTQIAKARQLDKTIADQGRTRPDRRYFTAKEAMEAAQRLQEDTGKSWTPVRAFAAKLDDQTQKLIREDQQGPAAMDSLGQRLLNDRIVTGPDPAGRARARNVVLVPTEYVDRLNDHLKPAGGIERFFQWLNQPFRYAVLPQPRWLVGNFVEPFLVRLPSVGSGAVNVFGLGVDVSAANRIIHAMERSDDPALRAAAEEVRARQTGGLLFGNRGATIRRQGSDIPGFAWASVIRHLPVVRQGVDLVKLGLDSIFQFNRAMESVAQKAALGRNVRRDVQEFTGSWTRTLHVQGKALDEAARGLTGTATQRRFVREVDELLGRYEGHPPWLRRLVQGPMPFLPWALNAARFVFWTMPAHRTVQTALLIKINNAVAKDWQDIHSSTPPGSLRLAIPTRRGGWVDVARYTPWGLTAEGNVPRTLSEQVAPQFSGALAALRGQDPFGRDLQLDPSENKGEKQPNAEQDTGVALYSLAEALVPLLATGRRLREGGGTPYAGSTIIDPDVKPGTKSMSAARRTFDPFRPTYLGSARSTVPAAGAGRARAMDQQARIDAALAKLANEDAVTAAQDDRINRALDAIGIP